MGLFRLLSPSRPENSKSSDSSSTSNPSSSSSSSPSDRPNLLIHLPTEGLIFFQPPEDAQVHALEHGIQTSYDQLVNGELEIRLPTGSEPRWCKAIRVGVRTTSKLNMGPDRMGEEDILFERMVEITDEGDQGVVLLIEGSQRYDVDSTDSQAHRPASSSP